MTTTGMWIKLPGYTILGEFGKNRANCYRGVKLWNIEFLFERSSNCQMQLHTIVTAQLNLKSTSTSTQPQINLNF